MCVSVDKEVPGEPRKSFGSGIRIRIGTRLIRLGGGLCAPVQLLMIIIVIVIITAAAAVAADRAVMSVDVTRRSLVACDLSHSCVLNDVHSLNNVHHVRCVCHIL